MKTNNKQYHCKAQETLCVQESQPVTGGLKLHAVEEARCLLMNPNDDV